MTPGGHEAPAVEAADLEARLARLRASVADPRAGLFGPGSHVWAINREAVIFLGGGRAALLQLAHPFVAQAVDTHSATRTDMAGRFARTFEHVFAMVYGDLDAACTAARRVHAIHRRITGTLADDVGPYAAGTPYAANLPDALLWVHATLWDTSVQVYELVVGPLSGDVKAAYYEETKRFAALFGIPDDVVPPDWKAFRRYVDGMLASPAITPSRSARALAHFLLRPPGTWIGPVWDWYAAVTARLLPPRLRDGFELAYGWREQALAEASLAGLWASWWTLPGRVRYLPAWRDGARRAAGDGPDPLDALVTTAARRVGLA